MRFFRVPRLQMFWRNADFCGKTTTFRIRSYIEKFQLVNIMNSCKNVLQFNFKYVIIIITIKGFRNAIKEVKTFGIFLKYIFKWGVEIATNCTINAVLERNNALEIATNSNNNKIKYKCSQSDEGLFFNCFHLELIG